MTDSKAGWDVGQYTDKSSSVMAGPVSYVGSGQPPFLIIPSDQDQVVPYTQSVELAEKLPGAGNPASLLVVKNSDHGFTRSAPRSTRL